jgi:hypothetical protein
MLRHRAYLLLTGGAVLLVLITFANIGLYLGNRSLQADVAARGQFIQGTVQLQGLYQEMVKSLAGLAVRNGGDPQLKDLLSKHGFNVSADRPASGTAQSGAR